MKANIHIIKCYKLLFTGKGIIKNIGSYIILFLLLISIILLFIFVLKDGNKFVNNINQIINVK